MAAGEAHAIQASRVAAWLVGLVALAGYGGLAWHTRDVASIDVTVVVVAMVLLFIPGLALLAIERRTHSTLPLWVVLVIGVASRLAFFGHEPYLSDDAYRYIWDGRVQAAELSPYGLPPRPDKVDISALPREHADWLVAMAPQLERVEADYEVQERVRLRVNHPTVPTIYPPLMELCFRCVAIWRGGLDSWRVMTSLADLLVAVLLAGMLDRRGRARSWVAVYFWHPLAVVENSWSAHSEIIAVLFLVAGVCAFERTRRGWGALGIGLGAAAKLLPIGLAPWIVRRHGWRPLVIIALCLLATAAMYWDTRFDLAFVGLEKYSESWYYNDIIYRPLGFAIGLDPEDRTLASTQLWRHGLQVSWLCACVVIGWRVRSIVAAAFAMAAVFVLLTPTLHPWYVLWLLPFAIVFESRAAILLSVTVLGSYIGLAGWDQGKGIWIDLWPVRVFEFGVPVLFAISSRMIRQPWRDHSRRHSG